MAQGHGFSQCKTGPCAAFVLLATENVEILSHYPSRLSNLLTSFDQPYFFNLLNYCMHYLLVLKHILSLEWLFQLLRRFLCWFERGANLIATGGKKWASSCMTKYKCCVVPSALCVVYMCENSCLKNTLWKNQNSNFVGPCCHNLF